MQSSSIQQQRAFLLLLFTTRRDRQCLVFFPITTPNVSMDRQALRRSIRESASAGWHTPFHFENTVFSSSFRFKSRTVGESGATQFGEHEGIFYQLFPHEEFLLFLCRLQPFNAFVLLRYPPKPKSCFFCCCVLAGEDREFRFGRARAGF